MPRWGKVPILVAGCAIAGLASQLVDARGAVVVDLEQSHISGDPVAVASGARGAHSLVGERPRCTSLTRADNRFVSGQSSPHECTCEDMKALEKDQINALELRSRFDQEAKLLDHEYPLPLSDAQRLSSQAAFKNFAEKEAPKGIEGPAGYSGPAVIEYTPAGFTSGPLATPEQQCARSKNAQRDLDAGIRGSVCSGMADAILAHEDYHQAQCVAEGGSDQYWHRSGADRAREERNAYGKEESVLGETIKMLLTTRKPKGCLDPRAPMPR